MDSMNSGHAKAFGLRRAVRWRALQRKVLRTVRGILGGLAFALTVLIACEKNAYAYTDPGSALLLWQMVVSVLMGAAYYFRKYILRIIGKGDKPRKDEGEDRD